MPKHLVFYDGVIRVAKEMCPTCIFRPGNLMKLDPGRVKDMVEDARKNDSAIICHDTLDQPLQAVCRGYFDSYETQPLQVAKRLGMVLEV